MTLPPFGWANTPATTTPLSAAKLEAFGAAIATYFESGQSAFGSPASVVTGSSLDAVGRTQVLARGDGVTPALRQFVFVDDAPFGAKGGVKRVTDGTIAIGTNGLSSTSAAFTSANIGNVVEVVGAGPGGANFNLSAYIGSVAGGVASLVTTSGGSTPSNAGATVSGATVTYGPDDSVAVNAAAAALSAIGGGHMFFSPLKSYWFSRHVPKSNVTYHGNGATFYVMPLPSDGGNTNQAVWLDGDMGQGSLGVANITFRDMVWVGHGSEVHNQWPFLIANAINVRFRDCDFSSFINGAINLISINGASVTGCTFTNVCSGHPPGAPGSTGNPINFEPGAHSDTYPMTGIVAIGNRITGQIANGIDITPGSIGNPPQTVPFRAAIVGNTITGATVTGSAIAVELGGTGTPAYPAAQVVIADNVCVNGGISAVFNGAAPPADQTVLSRIVIAGNTIDGSSTTGPCLDFRGSYATITGNVITGSRGANLQNSTGVVSLTGDFTNGSSTVNNVVGGGAITNGTQLQGLAGIPAGAFLLSGAGTATWTLSANFTGSTLTGQAFTATPSAQDVNFASNTMHLITGAVGSPYGVQLQFVRNSTLAGNVIAFDSGLANGYGINPSACGWLRIRDNDIDNASQRGIYAQNSNDLMIHGNSILNPSAAGAGSAGIVFNGVTGTRNDIINNKIVDDRAVHLMGNALGLIGFSGGTNMRVIGNTLLGSTGAAIDGLTGVVEVRGNDGYNPIGTVTPAVPATGVAVASQPYDRTFYVTAGASTCTMAIQNGPSPVIPASTFASIRVPAGKTVTPTFTNAPTWVVEAE